MKPDNWTALVPLLGTVLTISVTALGLYLGPKWAVKRAIDQSRFLKWWDKQQETYGLILEYLSVIRQDARIEVSALQDDYKRERGDMLAATVTKAYLELDKLTLQGDYLISSTAAKALQEFLPTTEGFATLQDSNDLWQAYCTRFKASTDCLSIVQAEAKRHFEAKPTI